MKNDDRTKQQLIHEFEEMHQRVAALEGAEGERKQRGEEPQKRE
jgi:hypothetical protein